MDDAAEPKAARAARRRRLRLLSYALAVAAVAAAAYPWATGAYTAWRQRSLRAEPPASRSALAATKPSATPATSSVDPFEGWESEDFPYWRGQKKGERFGTLVIPKLGLDVVLVKGSGKPELKKGPGWIMSTDYPGPKGNVGISGHRTTYGMPFRNLQRLKAGDVIELRSPYRVYRYQVTGTREVLPDDGSVMEYTEQPTITLSTCHPPYSAKRRLIVQGRLVRVERIPLPGSQNQDE